MKAYIWKDPHDWYGMIHLGYRYGPSYAQKMQHAAALHIDTIADLFGQDFKTEVVDKLEPEDGPIEIILNAQEN